jgi:prepilin-type N-terminal cleavage/methylation domain-containing protein
MSNKRTFSSKKSAFSLIELSIVLIIIGLLIAGITGGASLVNSSTMRAVMGEARGYGVAVNSFYSQFNAYPGDYNVALGTSNIVSGTAYSGGDGDSVIEYGAGEGTGALHQLVGSKTFDPSSVFPNSSPVGQMTYVASSAATAQTPGTNLPLSKSKGNGWAFDNALVSSVTQNVVVLTGTTAAGSSTSGLTSTAVNAGSTVASVVSAAALIPADALSIDTKLDDGKANTGRVTGYVSGCASGATYTVGTATKACALAFQIDPNL